MADATPDTPTDAATGRDYRETVFLPETPFPMRGGLPQKEPVILEQWGDLYATLRRTRQAQGAPLYVLHDGPPYANGNIHIGHALNKTLKDFVVRSRGSCWAMTSTTSQAGTATACRSNGRSRNSTAPRVAARTRSQRPSSALPAANTLPAGSTCSAISSSVWASPGDFDNRYATMDFTTEAAIVAEFHKFKNSGQLYRGSKPVMWSPVERTALADAEIEYHDHVSPTIWVKFPVVGTSDSHPGRSAGLPHPDAVGRDLDHHALDHPGQPGDQHTAPTSPTACTRSRPWRPGWSSSPGPSPATASSSPTNWPRMS